MEGFWNTGKLQVYVDLRDYGIGTLTDSVEWNSDWHDDFLLVGLLVHPSCSGSCMMVAELD